AGGGDGIVRLWEIAPGAYRGSLLAARDDSAKGPTCEWTVTTPQGYLAASPGWAARFRLAVPGAVPRSRLPSILASLNNPDLAVKALHGEKVDAPLLTAPAVRAPL